MSAGAGVLPETVTLRYSPPLEGDGVRMQFRLVYQGRLPGEGRGSASHTKVKHEIRRTIHRQLLALWNTHPFLKSYCLSPGKMGRMRPDGRGSYSYVMEYVPIPTTIEKIGQRFARCGYNFLPLIGSAFGVGTETACSVDILFLRRDEPGHLVSSGGDIDNRIKVLFDALRMPQSCDEIQGFTPGPDEVPFFCLLEDDKLINEVRVTTDRLLTPLGEGEYVNDVHLIIHVTTLTVGSVWSDVGYGPPSDDE